MSEDTNKIDDSPHSQFDWETMYRTENDLPWDVKSPAPELIEYIQSLKSEDMPRKVIEVGCGKGTNAIWLAENHCNVTATEIAPTALQFAKERATAAGLTIDFQLLDICEKIPVSPNSQDFAFDRGVFHVIPKTVRAKFAESLASTLKPGGYWLSLAGSKDQVRDDPEVGPPQLSAIELLEHIEPLFALVKLETGNFVLPNGRTYLAWKALYRKR